MPTEPAKLSLERLFASPSLSGSNPRGVKYSPDGKRVTFIKSRTDDSARYDLWQFDVATGEQSLLVDSTLLEPEEVELSEEEKALRERKRIAGQKGILSYDWGTDETILVPIGGDLWLIKLTEDGPTPQQLTQSDAFEYDAKVSPKGNYVSFVRDGAVYAIELTTGDEARLTPLAEPEKSISFGVAEFVAQEEMDRYTGYWWSPDERYIAYTKVDESTVDVIERFDITAAGTTVINQRYPRAGRPNAIVDLFVRDVETAETKSLSSFGPDNYLARVNWTKGNTLWWQEVNREQTLITYNQSSLPWRVWSPLKEEQQNWVNLSFDFKDISADYALMTKEITQGHPHSYAEDENGTPIRVYNEPEAYRHIFMMQKTDGAITPVTDGKWAVKSITGVDKDNSLVYFTGWKDTPLESHLYVTKFAFNGRIENTTRITELGKTWAVIVAPDGQSFVGTSSSPTQPPQTGLYNIDGTLITWIEENKLDENHPYFPYLENHTVPEYGTITAEDGQTLYYSIQLPPDFDSSKKYPVLLNVYGGPHAQTVTRNWERLSDQFYTHNGYIVFRLDNRGSGNRGKKFEDVIYRDMGNAEVKDQLKGVEFLKSKPFVDPEKIAIQGWSYGGYMTLMTMLQAEPGTFAAGVSGAPVTDWSLYDTFYTERYMGTPQNNPDGYERSSVFYHLDRFEGDLDPLLLIHGMADDNVIFENTTRLMAEMQEKGIHFELMTYPGQRHGIRGEKLSKHLMLTRMKFLDRHLKEE